MKVFKGLFVLAVYLASGFAQAAEPLLLGVVEEPNCSKEIVCDFGRDKACMDARKRKVRVLFARTTSGWMAPDTPEVAEPFDFTNVPWTIAFDGRNLGPVRTVDPGFDSPYESTYSRDYVLALADGQPLPEIANKDKRFWGRCTAPVYRPLVLVSQPNFADPDKWKPFKPGDSYRDLVLSKVREVMAASICPESKDGKVINVPVSSESLSKITAINLTLEKSYRDRVGRELVSVKLKTEITAKCAIEDYLDLRTLMFLKKGDAFHFIGAELQLIDAGDYDNDGRSEVMFWHSGNRDGYTLFYDDFRQRADYLWGYH